jgi:hypothetical protein
MTTEPVPVLFSVLPLPSMSAGVDLDKSSRILTLLALADMADELDPADRSL